MTTNNRILIVDDNESLCRIMRLILQRHGYNVTIAHDGFEFLQHIKAERFALVIMDIRMPKMDGVKALSTVRRNDNDLKIIMMTAYPVSARTRLDILGKHCRLIHKPFEMTDVLKIVEEMTTD